MGDASRSAAGKGSSGFRLLADTGVFVWKLFRGPRVPLATKLLLGGLGAYLVSPIDIIPDFLPVIGALDDAIVAAAVLGLAVRSIPRDVIEDLWESDVRFDDALALLRSRASSLKRRRRGQEAAGGDSNQS